MASRDKRIFSPHSSFLVPLLSFFFFIFSFFFVSCSNSKPEINFGFLQLVLYEEETGPRQQFSFFILAEDEDGLDNLDQLYLFHDREQLRWQINDDEWVSYSQDGQNWIGTRSISVYEDSLPQGVYRAVLVNKAGEKTERRFSFDGVVRYPFPELRIENENYFVQSLWPVNRLVVYDRNGNYSATVELESLSGQLSGLRLPANARTAALWSEDEENFCSAFTNVVPIN